METERPPQMGLPSVPNHEPGKGHDIRILHILASLNTSFSAPCSLTIDISLSIMLYDNSRGGGRGGSRTQGIAREHGYVTLQRCGARIHDYVDVSTGQNRWQQGHLSISLFQGLLVLFANERRMEYLSWELLSLSFAYSTSTLHEIKKHKKNLHST
jgi:hypothetical protein